MELTVKERIILLNILPAEGDILSLRIVRKLRETLSFSEEEHEALQIKEVANQVHWNTAAEKPKEVEIGPRAHALVADTLKALNAQKKLRMEHVELYEKVVPEE